MALSVFCGRVQAPGFRDKPTANHKQLPESPVCHGNRDSKAGKTESRGLARGLDPALATKKPNPYAASSSTGQLATSTRPCTHPAAREPHSNPEPKSRRERGWGQGRPNRRLGPAPAPVPSLSSRPFTCDQDVPAMFQSGDVQSYPKRVEVFVLGHYQDTRFLLSRF